MTPSRFASLACASWMLCTVASGQHLPVVQVASEITVVDDADLPGHRPPSAIHDDANSWLLTDESIDSMASSTLSELDAPWIDPPSDALLTQSIPGGDCECGVKHCHGVCRDPGHPKKPLLTRPGDRDRGDCPPLRYRMNDCQRAGNPHCYHRWAACGVNDKYSAWFVGGGSPFCFARSRTSSEGTWGLDYGGLFGHAKVWLNYTHGRNQGGVGGYRTDGEPKVVSRAHELLHLGHK